MLLKWLTWHSVYALEDDLDISLNSHTSVWVKLEVWIQSDVLIQTAICGTLFFFFPSKSVLLGSRWKPEGHRHFYLQRSHTSSSDHLLPTEQPKQLRPKCCDVFFPFHFRLTYQLYEAFEAVLFHYSSAWVIKKVIIKGPTFTEIHFQRQHFWTPVLLEIKLAFFLSTVQRLVFVP